MNIFGHPNQNEVLRLHTEASKAVVIPQLKEFQIWNDSKRKHYHYESEILWADIMPKLNRKSGYCVTVMYSGKIVLDTYAKTPQQAHKLINTHFNS